MKTPCFLRGFERGIQCYQTTHVSTYPKKATIPLNVLSYNILNLKAPLFKGVGRGIQCYQTTHVSTYPKKATIPLNVLSYNILNLKAPLFKGGWGGSNAIKQPTFPLTL
jgi:hypothetical protein